MEILKIRLIVDNVKRYGGFREKEVLKELVKIELIMSDENYEVYHFENKNGDYFEYDFKSHRITN
jgi:hypothetical protein